jgi:hypothetical protein
MHRRRRLLHPRHQASRLPLARSLVADPTSRRGTGLGSAPAASLPSPCSACSRCCRSSCCSGCGSSSAWTALRWGRCCRRPAGRGPTTSSSAPTRGEGFDPNDPNGGSRSSASGTADDDPSESVRHDAGAAGHRRRRHRMLSIPRDLWVRPGPTGRRGGSTPRTSQGPGVPHPARSRGWGSRCTATSRSTSSPSPGWSTAVGGVTHRDPAPGPRRGARASTCPRRDGSLSTGARALAYVRSRRYSELIDGTWRTDPTGDLGRVQRQQHLPARRDGRGRVQPQPDRARPGVGSAARRAADCGWTTSMGFFDALGFDLARRLRGLAARVGRAPGVRVHGADGGSGGAGAGAARGRGRDLARFRMMHRRSRSTCSTSGVATSGCADRDDGARRGPGGISTFHLLVVARPSPRGRRSRSCNAEQPAKTLVPRSWSI